MAEVRGGSAALKRRPEGSGVIPARGSRIWGCSAAASSTLRPAGCSGRCSVINWPLMWLRSFGFGQVDDVTPGAQGVGQVGNAIRMFCRHLAPGRGAENITTRSSESRCRCDRGGLFLAQPRVAPIWGRDQQASRVSRATAKPCRPACLVLDQRARRWVKLGSIAIAASGLAGLLGADSI